MKGKKKQFLSLLLSATMVFSVAVPTYGEAEPQTIPIETVETQAPVETPKSVEEPKATEAPVVEEPKTEEPKTEEPKAEDPKTEDNVQTETPKVETSATEESKTEGNAQTEPPVDPETELSKETTDSEQDSTTTDSSLIPPATNTSQVDEKTEGIITSNLRAAEENKGSSEATDSITANNSDEDKAFAMFKIARSTAKLNEDKIDIVLYVSPKSDGVSFTYNSIYLGNKDDAELAPQIQGTVEDGYMVFRFSIEKEKQGQNISFVPFKESDGTPYTSKNLVLTIPVLTTPTPSVPAVSPEPEPTEAPSQEEPTGDAGVSVVKEDDSVFKMFSIAASSAVLDGDKLNITMVTDNVSYSKIYYGLAEDTTKETVYEGTQRSNGGWMFTFSVPASDQGKKMPIALYNPTRDAWYTSQVLYITIPTVTTPTPEPEPTVTPTDRPLKVADGVYRVDEVESSAAMFRVVACQMTVKDGKMTAVITLSGTGYDYLYMGTKEQAETATASNLISYVENAEGQYMYTIPVATLDQGIAVAARSKRYGTFYDRTLTFKSASMVRTGDVPTGDLEPTVTPVPTVTPIPTATPTPTITPTPGSSSGTQAPDTESTYTSDTSGATSSVNSSTKIPDGVYTGSQIRFSFSGGTGRVNISCTKITVQGGQAYATIVFSSGAYAYVKANGRQYNGSNTSSTSTFTIPVALGSNNKVIGMTTKMSAAHEITYSMFFALNGVTEISSNGSATGGTVNEDGVTVSDKGTILEDPENPAEEGSLLSTGNKKLDEAAPEISGLTFKEAVELEYAKYMKIYRYEDDITLVEVDMKTGTLRENLSQEEENELLGNMEEENTTTSDQSEEVQGTIKVTETEEGAASSITTEEDQTAKLYQANVVKYLIVPEEADIPAGLEKDVVIIRQPREKVYVASEDPLNLLDQMDLIEMVAAVGMEKEDCTLGSVVTAMDKEQIIFGGTWDDIAFKDLVKAEVDMVILPESILPIAEDEDNQLQDPQEEKELLEEKEKLLQDMAEKYALLDIPMIIDRTKDEEEQGAQNEWILVYGAIFGCEDKAADLLETMQKDLPEETKVAGK